MNINSNGKSRIKQLVLVPVLMGALALIPASRVTAQTVTNLYSFQITGANATFAKLIEAKQRVVASAGEMSVVSSAFLLAVGLAHGTVHVQD
jgi:hypothetical protein